MSDKTPDGPIGRAVRVLRCEACQHGDNPGCVCHMIGGVYRITKRYEAPFAGTPTYHLLGRDQRVRMSEVEVVRETPAIIHHADATFPKNLAVYVLAERKPTRKKMVPALPTALRDHARGGAALSSTYSLMRKAADEIERLRGERDKFAAAWKEVSDRYESLLDQLGGTDA